MKPKKRQTRLTFEQTGSSSPSGQFSPARVRYEDASRSKMRSSSPLKAVKAATPARGTGSGKKLQKTLLDSVGMFYLIFSKVIDVISSANFHAGKASGSGGGGGSGSSKKPAPQASQASFMPHVRGRKKMVIPDDSEESAVEAAGGQDDSDDSDPALPPLLAIRSSQSVSTRLKRTVIDDDDEEDEEDSDDAPIVPSSSRRRRRPATVDLDDSDDSVVSPAKRRKVVHEPSSSSSKPPSSSRLVRREVPQSSSLPKRKGHRSDKEKMRELLNRRRAGEKIDKLTSSESSGDDEARGIYDTDSEDDFEQLKEFEDEESDVEPVQPVAKSKKVPTKPAQKARNGDEVVDLEEEDDDDFVVEDDDAPLGVPADLSIPLEFTAQAHKPLKEQFPYVIEWLVHNRINPAFERKDPVYNNAWRKLDDEVHGLANSKFTSSAWKPDFHRTLRARPTMEAYETGTVPGNMEIYESC